MNYPLRADVARTYCDTTSYIATVAPYTGAWIETNIILGGGLLLLRTRGRGLKHISVCGCHEICRSLHGGVD